MDEMGKKINRLRLEQGMTLEELGNKVGVGKSTVRKWENGMIANMKRDKIILVSKALNTTPSYLMGWEDKKETAAFSVTLNKDEQALMAKYNDLNNKGKEKVQGYASDLVDSGKYKKDIESLNA